MTGDRLKRIEDLFHQAVDMEPSVRSQWLANECGEDTGLYREVMLLLDSDTEGEGSFVSSQVRDALAEFHETDRPEVRMAGPYRLNREIGRGGMGTVYLGERADDEYESQVAIKLMRPGLDTDFFLERFRRERQILARLQHPNIARLLDSGSTTQGLPYIVMELVEGSPITEYCDDKQLSVDEILRLFITACSAVSYAHQHFVVHRDLKPGNIFVTNDGVPKLLDFGICKVVAPEGEAVTMTQGAQMLTPDYASPEQIRGDSITAASDVYSLGAVLYRLLTGVSPHKIERYTPQEIAEVICERDVERPSKASGDANVARRLAGDLDTVVLKALQKDPQRRYSSVEQFADDIRRHLDYLPVSARPDTLTYRFGKFARRNRGALAAGLAIFAALAAGLVIAAYQAVQARRHFTDARQLASALIFRVHERVRELPGSLKARQEIVNIGLEYLDKMSKTAGSDHQFRRELSAAYRRIGEIQGDVFGANTGKSAAALASFQKAFALLDPLPAARDVQIERVLILRQIADVQFETGATTEGTATLDRALKLALPLPALDANDYDSRAVLGDLYVAVARSQRLLEQGPVALSSITEAVKWLREAAALRPGAQDMRAKLATTLTAVGMSQYRMNQLAEARANHAQAISEWQSLVRESPANSYYRREMMLAYSHLGDILGNPVYYSLGDYAAANAAYSSMIGLAEQAHAANPGDQRALIDLGMAYLHAGNVPGRPLAEQIRQMKRAEELLAEASQANPKNANLGVNLAAVHMYTGEHLIKGGSESEARARWLRAVEMAEALFPTSFASAFHIATRSARNLGELEARKGRRQEALNWGRTTLSAAERAAAQPQSGSSVPLRAMRPRAEAAMAFIHSQLGDSAEAAEWRAKAIASWRQLQNQPGFHGAHATELKEIEALKIR